MDTNSAEQECHMNIETAEQETRMSAETAGVFSKRKTLLDDGTAVEVSSVPVRNYARAVLGQSHAASGREPVVRLPPNAPSSIKRRNVVQLRWEGGDIPAIRRVVVDKILAMGFKA
ncbi:hypothetical protein AB205_0054780 [Aquarana catesbeiana]|uniref:Uncharacterized protein n=1 Tax=Aquarana catesbeiana TaxID=8400 RepID=A0A2G9RID3_AQUCT|nr:hypothetical protein AB205_0054780 [Aquarana catesbeiana]